MKMAAKVRAIDKVYKRRNRYDVPDWQREDVWDKSKKQFLIDTILRGWHLPKLYLRLIEEDHYETVDGQQRLNAIFEFFDNDLPLTKESAVMFGGEYYRDLPPLYSDAFDDFEIQYDEITDATDEELKLFFQRLQAGLQLTTSERLNSIHSKLRDFCRELAKHAFFQSKVSFPNTRFAYFDIAAKAATIEIEGIETGLRYEDVKAVFEANSSFSTRTAVARNLRNALDYLDGVFPDKSPLLKNRTLVQSFITLTARIVRTGKADTEEKQVRDFYETFTGELNRQVELGQAATDSDYIAFQKTVNANAKEGAMIRHQILLRKLLTLSPRLAMLFDPTIVQESGLSARIAILGASISTLISQANHSYASKNGRDLFKPTNRTVEAQSLIRELVLNKSDYKDFIDNLYFLFHEGPGDRLTSLGIPASFIDINILRTDLQHDLDHGRNTKARAKRKALGSAFNKYSGQTSPHTMPEELFPAMQANLLTAIEADLTRLVATVSA